MSKDPFQETLDDLQHGELVVPDSDEQIKAEDSESEDAREGESVADAEQPEVQSDETQEGTPPQDEVETEAEHEPATGGEDEVEDKSDEPDEDGDQTFLIDGKTFTLAELRDLQEKAKTAEAERLMQADYTRKTQELAAERESTQAQRELTGEIVRDPALKEFVRAYPEVLTDLLADPEHVRSLLGNSEGVQKLWDRYEKLQDDPELAERLLKGSTTEEDEAVAGLKMRLENMHLIANAIDEAGRQVAEEFDNLEWEDVGPSVLKLVRFPEDPEAEPMKTIEACERLYHVGFTMADDGQAYVDGDFLRTHFEAVQSTSQRKASREEQKAESHNAAVDRALNKEKAPATRGEGTPPAPEADALPEYASANEAIADLMGYNK